MKTIYITNVLLLLSLIINGQEMKFKELNLEEKHIILDKGTEAPFTGRYIDFDEEGVFTCKQCGAELYNSSSKFDGHCGWPSFDKEIKNAVIRIPDADGRRTEIVCANCNGHLGHVFIGEQYTAENTRHCVNSVSMNFVANKENNYKTAIFASGCFWGTEYWMQKQKGVKSVEVGYTGGSIKNPSYGQVSTGTTGHVEAVEIVYNPDEVSYDDLIKIFFETHDPSQTNGQGPDIGSQYLSVIFYFDEKQKEIAEKYISILEYKGNSVVTDLRKASVFYVAENYHQNYYQRKGTEPYCHIYKKKF